MSFDTSTSLGRLNLIYITGDREPDEEQGKIVNRIFRSLAQPLAGLMNRPMQEGMDEAFEDAIGEPLRFMIDHIPHAMVEIIAVAVGKLLLSHFKIEGIAPETMEALMMKGVGYYEKVKNGTLDHLDEYYRPCLVMIKLKTILPEEERYRYLRHGFHISPWHVHLQTTVLQAVLCGMWYAHYIIDYLSEDMNQAKLSRDIEDPAKKRDALAINIKILLEGSKRAKAKLDNLEDVIGGYVYHLGEGVAQAFYLGCIWMFKGLVPFAKAVKFWIQTLAPKNKLSKEDFKKAADMFSQVKERLIYQLLHLKADFEKFQQTKNKKFEARIYQALEVFLESEDTWGCFGLGIRRSSEKVTTIGVFLTQLIMAECAKQGIDYALVEMFLQAFMLGYIRMDRLGFWVYNFQTETVDLFSDKIFSNYTILDEPTRAKFESAGVPEHCVALSKFDSKIEALAKGQRWGKGMRRETDFAVELMKKSGEFPGINKAIYVDTYSALLYRHNKRAEAHAHFDGLDWEYDIVAHFLLGALGTFVNASIFPGSMVQDLEIFGSGK